MHTPAPRLVIFDCDGVLVDSEVIAARAQSRALAAHGIAITPEEAARRFAGIPDADMWRTLQQESERSLPDGFARQYADRLEATFRQELRPLPGAAETVAALRGRGMEVCVASSSMPAKLEAALHETGANAAGSRWDLLVTDNRMPGANSMRVIELVRGRCGPLPALVVTGDTSPRDLAELTGSGVPVLHKPFRAAELLAAVEAARALARA